MTEPTHNHLPTGALAEPGACPACDDARGTPPTLQQAVDAIGEGMAVLLGPLVGMVQDRDEVLERLIPRLTALQESHAALLEFIDRMAVRPNWATDVRTLEQARALQESLTPPTGGPTT